MTFLEKKTGVSKRSYDNSGKHLPFLPGFFLFAGSIRAYSLLSLFPVMFACGQSQPLPNAKPSNVILISVDTLRADRLNSYGFRNALTSPVMDALSRDGILFENHITSSPWTTPAHLSIMTSLKPSSHGMVVPFREMNKNLVNGKNFFKLPDERVTLAEVLRLNGLKTAAFTAGGPMDPRLGFDQGFESYYTEMYKLTQTNMKKMTDWIEKNKTKRFFLFWHHFEVHAPYLHGDLLQEVVSEDVRIPVLARIEELSALSNGQNPVGRTARTQRRAFKKLLSMYGIFNRPTCDALYTGGVMSADRWLARLLKVLRDLELYDNTLIVLTSDHGEELGEHTDSFYNKHGHSVYEEIIRVPLIIKLPHNNHAGTRISRTTRTIDIMPTVLDIAGFTPEKHEMQGVSLKALWQTGQTLNPLPAYTEGLSGFAEKKSLRKGRYKYIVSMSKEQVAKVGRLRLPDSPVEREFYDLQTDPREKNNLLSNPNEQIAGLAGNFHNELVRILESDQGTVRPLKLEKETMERLQGLGYMN